MKRIIAIVLALCTIFCLAACGKTEPQPTQPQKPTSTQKTEYRILRTTKEVPAGIQMTPTEINKYFECYTTEDYEEYKEGVAFNTCMDIIGYYWTRDAIPSGTVVNSGMFTTQIPDGILPEPPQPGYNPIYGEYIIYIDETGMTMEIPVEDIWGALPEALQGKENIEIGLLTLRITDKMPSNDQVFQESMPCDMKLTPNGKFYLKSTAGVSETQGMYLGLMYMSYLGCEFREPQIEISGLATYDGKQYPFTLNGDCRVHFSDTPGIEDILGFGQMPGLADILQMLLNGTGGNGSLAELLKSLLGDNATNP